MSTLLPLGLSAADPDLVEPVAPGFQLICAALAGIGVIVALILWLKVHPFIALILGSFTVGLVAWQNVNDVLDSFLLSFGQTAANVGLLIALGAMFAKLLADSGGADQIVDTIVGRASVRALPWAMALIGAIIGLPMFFEIGLVLVMPVIYLVARRAQVSLVYVGIPALAGLSAMHGLVPPHPGPLLAIENLDANLGTTLGLGVLVAIPTLIIAGPLFGTLAGRWVVVDAPTTFNRAESDEAQRRPGFGITLFSVVLPVVLMVGKALVDILVDDEDNRVRTVWDILGDPPIALLITVLVAFFTLGRGAGFDRERISRSVESSLPPIAGIFLIVAAGGGFKQVLIDTGVGTVLAEWATDKNISVLLMAWVLAALIRLATGSATIATITASGLMASLTAGLSTGEVSLVVLAIGAGSVIFSHVNDAGFWLVKEYFGMTVGQTFKTWSLMETVLSVSGLVFVLLLGLVV